jgi:alkylation response protein AidB-like acyl-CoA dehydrogenase
LQGAQIASEDRLGEAAVSENAVNRLLELSSTSAALQMMGIAGKVLDLSTAHATDRIQFGKPIATFQAIKHKCADMAVAIEAGRSAAYYAAWAVTELPTQCSKPVSIAKAFAGDTVSMVCNEGIQIHGGMGFTWELGLHLYLRRAKLLEHLAGDGAYHRERVISETLAELELT